MSYEKIKDSRSKIYEEYLKFIPMYDRKEITKMEIYEILAKKCSYKNANVVYHTIRRIEDKIKNN